MDADNNYVFHPGLNLRKGDWGKCIIYSPDRIKFYFKVSKIPFVSPNSNSPDYLRKIFNNDFFDEITCRHKYILSIGPEKIYAFGGGAYFMISDNLIFADGESGDFGQMNKPLLTRILKNEKLKLQTIDDKFFNIQPLKKYLDSLRVSPKAEKKPDDECDPFAI